jgi:hypothetical protein
MNVLDRAAGRTFRTGQKPKQGGRQETLLRFQETLPIRNFDVKGQIHAQPGAGSLIRQVCSIVP